MLGRPVSVLSGEDEARLSALGVEASFHEPHGVIGDLGGSSLEFMQVGKGKGRGESLMLGPLSLMEVGNDPKDLRKAIRSELKKSDVLSSAKGRFFAVGGAWRTFAKVNMELENYALQVLHGYQMNQGQIARTAKLCIDSLSNPASRSLLETIDKRRARHMPIAAIVLEELLSISKLDGVSISSAGLREGVLTDLTGAAVSDPLLDGVIAFVRLDHNQIAFGQALHDFIAPAFAPEAGPVRVTSRRCQDRKSRLHDVGQRRALPPGPPCTDGLRSGASCALCRRVTCGAGHDRLRRWAAGTKKTSSARGSMSASQRNLSQNVQSSSAAPCDSARFSLAVPVRS